jgi:PAS domain S-box-containing protein
MRSTVAVGFSASPVKLKSASYSVCNQVPKVDLPRQYPTLQFVLETALDAVVVMDADGLTLDWNLQAEKIFGWDRAEVIGKEMGQFIIPARYRDAHAKGLRTYLQTGEGPVLRKRIEISGLRKDGSEFPVELSISPVIWDGQTFFLGFLRDITDRRKAEKILESQAREALLLHRVTALAAETSSREEVLQLCLESVCELTGWPTGHAYICNPDGSLVSAGWAGGAEQFAALRRATEAYRFSLGVGLPGRILETAEPEWIADVTASELFVRKSVGEDLGVRAAFGFPIIIGHEVVAVLEFFSLVPLEPDPNLLLTARIMGYQVGRVVERRRVQDHQALLLSELNHRAKNMLAVVMGMASQTAREATSVEEFTADFFGRLSSLSRAYGLLTAKNWEATNFESLVSEVVEPHLASGRPQLLISGIPLLLPPKVALAMSMILHELTTNATKYGALSIASGEIRVSSRLEQGPKGPTVFLTWEEAGVSGTTRPVKSGFGTKLIETSVRHELGGRVTTTFGPNGVRYDFEFPKPM